jgi:hypothetical protein
MAFFEKIILSANNASLMVGVWRFGKLKFFNIFQMLLYLIFIPNRIN